MSHPGEPGSVAQPDRFAAMRRCRESGGRCPLLAGSDRPDCDQPAWGVAVSFPDDQGQPVHALVGWSTSAEGAQACAAQLTDPESEQRCQRIVSAAVVNQSARTC